MISTTIVTGLLWAAALSSGLIAGVYFTFSGFVIRAFGEIDTTHAIAAMNSINKTILRSAFMPLFFGSSIISVLLMILTIYNWSDASAALILLAGAVYFIGMFVCTLLFNVPLNNSLAGIDSSSSNAQQIWSRYLTIWTNWNHLRTISSLVTCIICLWILSKHTI